MADNSQINIKPQDVNSQHRWCSMVFYRADGFYPLTFRAPASRSVEDVAAENAKANPGTILVEDISGNVLWEL